MHTIPIVELDDRAATALTEQDKVETWRIHVLLEAGYTTEQAVRIAVSDADLHQAVELVHAGCPHRLAADIVT